MAYREISKCRISGSSRLEEILHLGEMALTGVFPKSKTEKVPKGPLSLVYCHDSNLLQLKQSYPLHEMYGPGYGYRSGLNASMVKHLTEKAQFLAHYMPKADAVAIDIGGNDGTFLRALPPCHKVLVDPTAHKWEEHHKDLQLDVHADFFPCRTLGQLQADLITSIACFYDLEDPVAFVRAVAKHLKTEGVWHFEQSYLPAMLKANAYDTIVHEHLEYYSFRVVEKLLRENGLKVIHVAFNDVNGGSFAVTAAHAGSKRVVNHDAIREAIMAEPWNMEWADEFVMFRKRVIAHREDLRKLVKFLKDEGHSVAGLGASTKGNVLLQFCGFTADDIEFISDVNPEKWGRYTPGSLIPIISEEEARKRKPDYMLVLPWHFREGIIEREKEYLQSGGSLIFPLPTVDIVKL